MDTHRKFWKIENAKSKWIRRAIIGWLLVLCFHQQLSKIQITFILYSVPFFYLYFSHLFFCTFFLYSCSAFALSTWVCVYVCWLLDVALQCFYVIFICLWQPLCSHYTSTICVTWFCSCKFIHLGKNAAVTRFKIGTWKRCQPTTFHLHESICRLFFAMFAIFSHIHQIRHLRHAMNAPKKLYTPSSHSHT